jgi:hypothetical protein
MALGEDSPIYSKPDSLLLQLNRCKLLAGGHEKSCGRPDIPGTEEKQVAEKKKCAKKTPLAAAVSPRVEWKVGFSLQPEQRKPRLTEVHALLSLSWAMTQ